MLRKLSIILILTIVLSACSTSAPMPEDTTAASADKSEGTVSSSDPAESNPEFSAQTQDAENDQAEAGAEYFYFTKYSNTVSNDEGLTVFCESRCTPSFTSPDQKRSEWVSGILGDIDRDFKTDSTNLHQYAEDFLRENGTDYFYSYSNYQQLDIARHDEAVVSLISLSSLYSGGSHPNAVQTAYNMDISYNRLLRLEDVIEEKSASELAYLVRTGVDSKFAMIDGGNGLFENYADTIATSMIYGNMTPYWYFNDVGLVIFYNQYELGPYAAGIIKVELPYKELEGILLEDYFPAQGDGIPGNLVMRGEWEGYRRIPITLDEKDSMMLVGVEGTVYQVQLSEVNWLDGNPIAQDLRFSALRLGQNDVLEISGGSTDETKSYIIEFVDGRGERMTYHIRNGELTKEP